MSDAVLRHDLTIWRGARFLPHAWPLFDKATGEPKRSPGGLEVVAKIRRYEGDDEVLHPFAASLVMLTIPGHYDGLPVVAAQLDEIPHTVTAALGFDRGVWDLMVDHEAPQVGGTVHLPLAVSRT